MFLLRTSPFLPWLLYGAETFSWERAREGSGGEEMPFCIKETKKKNWIWDVCNTPRIHPDHYLGGFFLLLILKYSEKRWLS